MLCKVSGMQIQSAFNSSLMGIQTASESLKDISQSIASSSLPSKTADTNQLGAGSDTVADLVSLIEDKNTSAANVKALQTASDMLGTIIDIKA